MGRLSPFALAAFALACGNGGPIESGASINGTYNLSTVNGSPPPFLLVATPDHTLRITSGTLVINTANTYSTTTNFEEMDSGQATTTSETCTGTYTRTGNGLVLAETVSGETCGGNFLGTWDGGNTITVDYHGSLRMVYTK